MLNTVFIVLLGFVLIGCKSEEKQQLTIEATEIKKALIEQKKMFDVPGIAFGMINNDTVVYADAHGLRNLQTKRPMNARSVFHMASVSKPFVATAIVQLVEQGKIDLDEKLTHYLPYFEMADERYKDISIRQMLAHTSGIPNTGDYEWDKPQYDEGAAERYVRSHKTLTLDFTPGEKYSYSNPAFDILCDVIAKVSDLPFEDYMKKNIFEPIGMKNSTFYKPEVSEDLATSPHILDDSLRISVSEIYPYNRRHAGSSTLHSNVEDMLLWAKMNLNKGSIDGRQIYNEASYKLLTTIHTPEGSRKVGLSWFLGNVHETPVYYHSGQDTGFKTFFAFMPEKRSAVVMMVNTDKFWIFDSAAMLLKRSVFKDSIKIEAPIHFKMKDYILTDGIEKTKEIYFQEEQKAPQRYTFDNGGIDDLGYWLIDRGHLERALDVFIFNTELEPEHAGWVDSVADAYKEMDSLDQAIHWYKKALEMKPDQDFSRRKLEKLLEENTN